MSTDTADADTAPTIVDVAAAVVNSHGADDPTETLDVLSFIARHQQAEAAWRENTAWDMPHRETARYRCLSDGVAAALAAREVGGTTRDYERAIGRVQDAIAASWNGPVLDWYVADERARLEQAANGQFGARERSPHPMYRTRTWIDRTWIDDEDVYP